MNDPRPTSKPGPTRWILDEVLRPIGVLVKGLQEACHRIEVTGAARREERLVDQVDLLAIPKIEPAGHGVPAHNFLWAVLDGYPELVRVKGADLMRAFYWPVTSDEVIRVNLYTARPETWGYQMVLRTGCQEFWQTIVQKLRERGYATVDGELVRISDGEIIPVQEEEDLFRLAGFFNVFPPNARRPRPGSRSSW